ncbi:unnamed protein product [Zymoseptoria tritici ST99CH_3D1]|uniref:Uncharacterized protein n=1 Tax=Zymoseptoria tritici (strain ST99CH_3D7) TaxID=1276538 RepID=A0A1X7RX69_ZYMT9|nr:unnamed protein product [Zymoseptoria tritici ST99CH_3D7]SMR56017.1 unnamed protein product [Zymoseptoria tritici ST99CH_3D1]
MAFITNWVTDKLAGYAATGLQAGGTLAGNAVGGVGSLVENSGRSVGQSANGAIGGVGNYINGYGNGVMGAMAADGPVGGGGQKKVAVKPTAAAATAPKALPPARAATKVPATRSLPASKPKTASLSSSTPPSKPPPSQGVARTLPSKKPAPAASISQTPRTATIGQSKVSSTSNKPSNPRAPPAKRFDNSKRPSISTPANERTADGKVRISPASRPRPVRA